MGFFRKLTSISTGGLVDFRSDKERTAAYTRRSRNEAIRQTALLRRQTQDPSPVPVSPMTTELERLAALHRSGALTDMEFAAAKAKLLGTTRPAGWYDDGGSQRWWDGEQWADG